MYEIYALDILKLLISVYNGVYSVLNPQGIKKESNYFEGIVMIVDICCIILTCSYYIWIFQW